MSTTPRPSGPPPAPTPQAEINDEEPGVPGFARWRGVYGFVAGVFALTVVFLALFARYFS